MSILLGDKYKLIKQDPGWELQKWDDGGAPITKGRYQGGTTKAGWRRMGGGNGCYPHNIKHALMIIAEQEMLDVKKDKTLKECLRELFKFEEHLGEVAKVIEEKVGQGG